MSATSSQFPAEDPRQRQVSQAERTAEAKIAFTESLKSAGTVVDTELQERAKNIHANDKALAKQERDLQKETKKLAKQNDTMQKFVDKSSNQLSSIDNLDPLHSDLDKDLDIIERMLEMLEEETQDANSSTGFSESRRA